MVDATGKLYEVCSGIEKIAEGMKLQPRQKAWHAALRHTNLLIQAGKLEQLEEYIQQVPCSGDKEYLCGLLMQLEAYARTCEDPSTRDKSLEKILSQSKLDSQRVQAWVKLVSETFN